MDSYTDDEREGDPGQMFRWALSLGALMWIIMVALFCFIVWSLRALGVMG